MGQDAQDDSLCNQTPCAHCRTTQTETPLRPLSLLRGGAERLNLTNQLLTIENNNSSEKNVRMSGGDAAVAKFSDMIVQRLKEIKASDWKQGWTNGKGCFLGMPQNIAGRNYSGTNSFFLQMDTAMNGYPAPVYATFCAPVLGVL